MKERNALVGGPTETERNDVVEVGGPWACLVLTLLYGLINYFKEPARRQLFVCVYVRCIRLRLLLDMFGIRAIVWTGCLPDPGRQELLPQTPAPGDSEGGTNLAGATFPAD